MPVTIRSRLLLLVLAVLLPGLIGAFWLIANTLEAERVAHERSLRDTSRALSMVVGRELAQRAAVARALSVSRWLDDAPNISPEHLAAFERQGLRALEGLDGWLELRAADRLVLDTRRPPALATRVALPALLTSASVLPLQIDPGTDGPHAAVVQPVERGGAVALNLLITLMPHELQRIIDAQNLPADWVGTVMDDQGIVIARHPGGNAAVGRSATADLRERMAKAPEGLFESVSLDGRPATGYYSKSPQGWSYVSAMPREQFNGLAQRAVWQVALGAFVLLSLAVVGALAVSRSIVGPVLKLKAAAGRLQAGEPLPAPTPSGIAECDEVEAALADASRAIGTARSELERKVADAIARTRQAEQRLSQGQRVEALGRLTGGVAHDFNNLLGIISNSVHLMGRHAAASDLEVPLAATRRAVHAGHQLTQHLLSFAGRRPVTPQPVQLSRYLPEVLELMRSVLGSRAELSVKVAPDTAPILVDVGELELALINLALNARDAMPQGGELLLAARNATQQDRDDFGKLEAAGSGPHVLITVQDDGIGIAPEVIDKVFEPFFTTKAFGQGSGLGLSQVHGFSTQAGGAVRVASTPGIGTTVLMLLPVAAKATSALAVPDSTPAAPMAGMRLLLVDDNESLADVTEVLLREHGALVQRAKDAAEALRVVAAAQPGFDLVLTDVVMPGEMDGLGLAQTLQRENPDLPVVLISGYSPTASAEKFPFLRKPCPPDEMLAVLGRAVTAQARRKPGLSPAAPD